MQEPLERQRELEREARTFGRHLVGRTPPAELVERYCEAMTVLLAEPPSARDAALLGFALRHPWSVSCLDAAAGWLDRDGLLRSKLLVMTAVLETSPTFADEFLPRTPSPAGLLGGLAAVGVATVARLVVGLVLWPLALRTRA